MLVGCHLPVYGPAATREVLLGFARRMEALGYDSLWASDHVVIPYAIASRYPYNPTGDFPLAPATSFLEPLVALGLVAGVTERIRLGTTVLVLPHRHPVLAAKMLATLDHLAPGRVILGAGVGWMKEEIELFGVPYERRGAWSDEAIRVMKACWRDERVSHRGEFLRFEALGVRDVKSLTISARMGLPARQDADTLVGEIRELDELAGLGVSHLILESRVRDLDDLTAIYEKFANVVRPRL